MRGQGSEGEKDVEKKRAGNGGIREKQDKAIRKKKIKTQRKHKKTEIKHRKKGKRAEEMKESQKKTLAAFVGGRKDLRQAACRPEQCGVFEPPLLVVLESVS